MVFPVTVMNFWPQDWPHITIANSAPPSPLSAVTSPLHPLFMLIPTKATTALALGFGLRWGVGRAGWGWRGSVVWV